MTVIDATRWAKVNLWRHPSGELCVRPGLRRVHAPVSGRVFVGGFSVQNSYTREVWHYVFDVADSARLDLKLRVLDETFQVWQVFSVNSDVMPRVITHAVVEGQLLICSPDFPTIFGIVGSSVRFASAVASADLTHTAIAVPRGICSRWCNRVVIADGRSVFPSDPVAATGGDVRTFVAENQNQRPGVVFGLHEGAGDALVAVTSDGTYALSADAAAVSIVGSNGTPWRLTSHTAASSYASSVGVRGRVYALTRDGYAMVDTETTEETRLAEPLMPRSAFARVSLADFRSARMYATDEGPIVCHDGMDAMHRSDVSSGIGSWWRSSYAATDFHVRGVLRTLDGTELLLCENGVFAADGDFDGEIALTSEVASVTGSLFAPLPYDPSENRMVRGVDVGAAVGGSGSTLAVSVRGSRKSASLDADGNGYTIGTVTTGRRLTTTPIGDARFQFGAAACERTADVSIEVEAAGCLNRIATSVNVEYAESRRNGPVKVA